MIVDVDHHLDARQMRRQRSTVDAAGGGVACPLGWRRRFVLGFSARRRLLDLFEAEQQLIFRQRFGPSAEAVTLQLLDDLLQPFGARTFRQQHRLERAGIVGKRVHRRHMARLHHVPQRPASISTGLIHSVADQPGCTGAGVSRAA